MCYTPLEKQDVLYISLGAYGNLCSLLDIMLFFNDDIIFNVFIAENLIVFLSMSKMWWLYLYAMNIFLPWCRRIVSNHNEYHYKIVIVEDQSLASFGVDAYLK